MYSNVMLVRVGVSTKFYKFIVLHSHNPQLTPPKPLHSALSTYEKLRETFKKFSVYCKFLIDPATAADFLLPR